MSTPPQPLRIGDARPWEPAEALILAWAGARLGDWQRMAAPGIGLPDLTPRTPRPRASRARRRQAAHG